MLIVYLLAVNYANCSTKTALLHTWQTATDDYARHLSAFSHRIGTAMSSEEYDRLQRAMKNARELSKQARKDFQAHIDQHQCASGRA
jgi:hypothetical protein